MKSFFEKESRMTEFKSNTVKSVVPVSIDAPVAKVFPLVCPVEEYKWIPRAAIHLDILLFIT